MTDKVIFWVYFGYICLFVKGQIHTLQLWSHWCLTLVELSTLVGRLISVFSEIKGQCHTVVKLSKRAGILRAYAHSSYLICCTNNNHNADSIQYSEMNIYLISTTWNYFLSARWKYTTSKLAGNFGPCHNCIKAGRQFRASIGEVSQPYLGMILCYGIHTTHTH